MKTLAGLLFRVMSTSPFPASRRGFGKSVIGFVSVIFIGVTGPPPALRPH
jgi:hypothetical protein